MVSLYLDLIALINGEFNSRTNCFLAEFIPKIIFKKAALKFISKHGMAELHQKKEGSSTSIFFSTCQANYPSIHRMHAWLKRNVKDDILPAVLHGSLGTNEVVPYSDFDALVIIKNEVLKDYKRLARTAFRLFQARRFMYEQDPLQHHGWFVLPEYALTAWPESYLPVAVLKNAAVLTESEPISLTLTQVFDLGQSEAALNGLLQGIMREIRTGLCFKNLYQFKSTISKVLLMPAFYVQVRDGRGVFKRDSFDLAKTDFTEAEWQPMETASAIRRQWPLLGNGQLHFLGERPGFMGNVWRKHFSPPVPMLLRKQFDEKTVDALKALIYSMGQLIHSRRIQEGR